ncbi:Protein UXT-like protein [Hordeum vulgare]|nr:Protein UXT-like protein [Hordeum vulgare]
MITNKDSREEKRGQDKEEQIKAVMDIQIKKFELKAEKHAKMLDIKAREVWLACMTKGVDIMMVDLSTVSPRKRSWFEKMQSDMLNLHDE